MNSKRKNNKNTNGGKINKHKETNIQGNRQETKKSKQQAQKKQKGENKQARYTNGQQEKEKQTKKQHIHGTA